MGNAFLHVQVKLVQTVQQFIHGKEKSKMASTTPWGSAQHSSQIVRGLMEYSTSSHGGVHVSSGLAQYLSDFTKSRHTEIDKDGGYWFEEDCEALLPLYDLGKALPSVKRAIEARGRKVDDYLEQIKINFPDHPEVTSSLDKDKIAG